MQINFEKLKVSGVSKIRNIGSSKGLILHKNLFKSFNINVGDNVIVFYDEDNDCVVIKRGGM